ncbi:hypothetical protein GC174_13475 [bacterium]|nr:hypothetical protein [bacterium]
MKSSSALNRSKPVIAATVALIGFALGLGLTSNSIAFGQGQGGGTIPLQMPFNNNAPNPMQGILNQPLTNTGPGAIVVPPISFVDINTGRFGKLEIDLDDGEFMEGSCKNIHLVARDMDLREGLLKSLDISLSRGNFQDFIVDTMSLSTKGSLRFDTGVLFNQKVLQFTEPAEAQVEAEISQESLNSFLKSPHTLDRLSVTAGSKVGAIAGLLGANAPQIGLVISDGNLALGKRNSVNISLDSKVGMGQYALNIPVEIDSKLELRDGWVKITDTKLKTSGKEISPQLSNMIVQKVNNLSSLGTRSDDIHFKFTSLEVKAGKKFIVKGTASINRLRFGRS